MSTTRPATPSENSPMYVGPRAPRVPVIVVEPHKFRWPLGGDLAPAESVTPADPPPQFTSRPEPTR